MRLLCINDKNVGVEPVEVKDSFDLRNRGTEVRTSATAEIEDHGFAPELRQGNRVAAAQLMDREIGRRVADAQADMRSRRRGPGFQRRCSRTAGETTEQERG